MTDYDDDNDANYNVENDSDDDDDAIRCFQPQIEVVGFVLCLVGKKNLLAFLGKLSSISLFVVCCSFNFYFIISPSLCKIFYEFLSDLVLYFIIL